MLDDPFTALGTQLREDLRSLAGRPPSASRLRRRHQTRRTIRTLGTAAAAAVLVVNVPQLVGSGGGVAIDPAAPSSPSTVSSEGTDPQVEGVDVREIDMPEPVAARMLAVQPNNPSLAVFDLDVGELSVYPLGVHGLPADAISGARVMSEGSVVVWQDDTVRVFSAGLTSPTLEHTPHEMVNPPGAAPSIRVVPTRDQRALWVIQVGPCCLNESPGRAELVDLATGRVQVTVEIPPSTFPVVATKDGVLLNTMQYQNTADGAVDDADSGWTEVPGSDEALLLTEDGRLTDFADGDVLGANENSVAVRSCEQPDTADTCGLALIDIATGEGRRLELPIEGTVETAAGPAVPGDFAPWSTTSRDGRILVTVNAQDSSDQRPTQSHLVIIDPATDDATVVRRFEDRAPPAAWARDGEHILLADSPDVTVLNPRDDTSFTVHDAIPDGHFVAGIG